MIRLFRSRQFLLFLMSSGTAAVVNFSSRIVYSHWLHFSAAVVLAFITGMVTAFLLARTFVFKNSTQAAHRSAMFFVLVNLVALLQTWAISVALALYVFPSLGFRFFPNEIAHAIGIAAPVFTSYLGHRRWSFRA